MLDSGCAELAAEIVGFERGNKSEIGNVIPESAGSKNLGFDGASAMDSFWSVRGGLEQKTARGAGARGGVGEAKRACLGRCGEK